MYLSFSARVILDAEALNMAESAGNYTRHRRAPLVVKTADGGYVVRYVPAISGESIAHGYQAVLAELALKDGLPVCRLCARGEFVKHAAKELFAGEQWEDALKDAKTAKNEEARHNVEKAVVEHCVVEDVGGFLYTDALVRRTAKAWFGYALPSRAFYQAAALEPQLHTRVSAKVEKKSEEGQGVSGQMLYYVETGSAVYALSGLLDICGIGCTTMVRRECVDDAVRRRKLAVEALAVLLGNMWFGAKRSRFLPGWELESAVFALSKKPFMVTSAHVADYIEDTVGRAKIAGDVAVLYYGQKEVPSAVKLSAVEELPKRIDEEKLKCP
ncbi:MAG: type I-A CRISPR-associated protein Cas7/Csa2 [Thermoproteus sp.]